MRLGILAAIAVVLVAGFWVHREFYQFGFYLLLVVGGSLTFLVMVVARYAASGRLSRRGARGALTFPLEEGERLLQREVDAGRALQCVVEQDVEREGGLHRARGAAEQGHAPRGDPAPEDLMVEPLHERLHGRPGHGRPLRCSSLGSRADVRPRRGG